MKNFIIVILYVASCLLIISCGTTSQERHYGNGDLTSTSDTTHTITSSIPVVDATPPPVVLPEPLTPERQYEQQKQALLQAGWEAKLMNDGQMPRCYNFKPRYDKDIDNKLEVTVGGGTDVVTKLMDRDTERCVRYVYINSGSTYEIQNIPEGVYYLKIAYGRDWLSRIDEGGCIGKFLSNSIYNRSDDEMDFRIQRNEMGYSIPSFSLKLDVVSNDMANSFNSSGISENEFNQ